MRKTFILFYRGQKRDFEIKEGFLYFSGVFSWETFTLASLTPAVSPAATPRGHNSHHHRAARSLPEYPQKVLQPSVIGEISPCELFIVFQRAGFPQVLWTGTPVHSLSSARPSCTSLASIHFSLHSGTFLFLREFSLCIYFH